MPIDQDLEKDMMNPEEESEVTITGECFDKTIPVENGDSVLFTIEGKDEVSVGKYVEELNCVIRPDGTKVDRSLIDNWYHIPFNIVQEKLNTEAFRKRYDELMCKAVPEMDIIEKFISNNVENLRSSFDNDTEFLISLFTRNVRNERIDFSNYKFMIGILMNQEHYCEYDSNIDLRNLNSICYNMYSIMDKISIDTYETIYKKLVSYTPDKELF